MYNAKRDGYGNGANLAIPSMGEIEGRIAVLKVVAIRLTKRGGGRADLFRCSTAKWTASFPDCVCPATWINSVLGY